MPVPHSPFVRCALLALCGVLSPFALHAESPEATGLPYNTSPLFDERIVPPAVVGRPLNRPGARSPSKPQKSAAAKPVAKKTVKVERDAASTSLRDDVGKGTRLARQDLQPGAYIGERHRQEVRAYYARAYAGGKSCPAGVAKTAAGCAAAGGHAWRIGQPLPATTAALPVPPPVMAKLPPTPPGHRYVQVAGDILLIAAGSKMVVDGIDGLLRM